MPAFFSQQSGTTELRRLARQESGRVCRGHACFAVAAEEGSPFRYVRRRPAIIPCVKHKRAVGRNNCVRYAGRQRHRHHFVYVTVQVHEYPDATIALFHGHRAARRLHRSGTPDWRRSQPNQLLKPLGGHQKPKRIYSVLRKPQIVTCATRTVRLKNEDDS
jgi:hypothetical protein